MAEVRTRADQANIPQLFTVSLFKEVTRPGGIVAFRSCHINHHPLSEPDAVAFACQQMKLDPCAIGYELNLIHGGGNHA